MYFNYGVINMQSIYFFLPSPNVVQNIVQMQLYIYLSVSIPVQGFYFVWGWVFFFPDSSMLIYVTSEAGPGKKKGSIFLYL